MGTFSYFCAETESLPKKWGKWRFGPNLPLKYVQNSRLSGTPKTQKNHKTHFILLFLES
jgi:hypothetical protein